MLRHVNYSMHLSNINDKAQFLEISMGGIGVDSYPYSRGPEFSRPSNRVGLFRKPAQVSIHSSSQESLGPLVL